MQVLRPLTAPIVASGMVGASLAAWACYAHRQWQESIERERFVLSMKAASTPESLAPEERERLRLLRAPWWGVWRWIPAQLGQGDDPR